MNTQPTELSPSDTALTAPARRGVLSRVVVSLSSLVILGMLGAWVWWVYFGPELMVFSNSLAPSEQYRLMTGLEPTPDVADIEGIGGGWQGHDFWLRFRCDPATIDRLVAQGFVSADPETTLEKLDFKSHARGFDPDHFTPDWDPGNLEGQRCFQMRGVRNDWTAWGETYFAFDPRTGWVHLYQSGS